MLLRVPMPRLRTAYAKIPFTTLHKWLCAHFSLKKASEVAGRKMADDPPTTA